MIRILNKNDNKELSELIKIALIENIFIVKKKNHHFFGYFIGDKLVGIVGYFTMKKYKTIGFINAFVLPEYRKYGIYRKLAEERFNFCVENYKGFKVFISVNSKSRPQIEKLGFKLIEVQYRMCLNI
jgi:GNAT superfamily N-acetyltransferase